jgi:hypothetical protein
MCFDALRVNKKLRALPPSTPVCLHENSCEGPTQSVRHGLSKSTSVNISRAKCLSFRLKTVLNELSTHILFSLTHWNVLCHGT